MTINIENVGRKFGRFTALKQINLKVEDGEFLAILGPSGCGKTTLLRLLAGFDAPSSGRIEIDDRLVGSPTRVLPPEKRNIGMVFQSFALWPHMTVREHIEFPLIHHRFTDRKLKKDIKRRTDEVLKIIKMEDLAERKPAELSGGQKQRVALGRAIAPQPKLLLMDEPLSSLDAELRINMRTELQEIHHLTGASIIYVTHDQSEALAMADRIAVMQHGSIEQVGTPRNIYNHPGTSFVARFVGKANLVKGRWNHHFFLPALTSQLHWLDDGVAESLKRINVYPVRPEEIDISQERPGIAGSVTNVQFQGKEIHYTVRTDEGDWHVNTDVFRHFDVGETVSLRLKSQSSNEAGYR
ncbi:MAG: ABC transporter ATP-binding protein [Sporolactobacillus sp.]|nr:ABC transporter ATP-binding protein [Sporolactobacillus sp.]